MRFKMYVIYDIVTETHTHPITIQSDRDAIEQFRQLVNDPQTHYFKHPTDYLLMSIGEYDQQEGKITPFEKNKTTARAIELKEQTNEK